MISIVMATYNGEKFIEEQLRSICEQTVKPDEIIVQDDLSTDNTLNIVYNFKEQYKNIKWIINKNKCNYGYKRNFYEALNNATGEYIFLADQDDIWINNKIELMIEVMKKNENIYLLMANLETFYQENCTNKINLENFYNKRLYRFEKINHCINTPRPGCNFCIKKDLLKKYNEIINFDIPHDNLLWQIASIEKRAYLLNEVTMYYRRHSINASNNQKNSLEKRIKAVNTQISELEHMINYNFYNEDIKDFLSNQRDVFIKRKEILQSKNMLKAIFQIRYLKYYFSLRLYLVDIYYIFKFKNEEMK